MHQESFRFQAGDESIAAIRVTDTAGDTPRLLLLHGGGTSTKERYLYLAQELTQYGIGSISLDFSGHGESTGTVASSSLAKRTAEATEAVRYTEEPRAIFGSSMGAYTAVQLTKQYPVETLILFNPAMYTRRAYAAPFTSEFSRLIREPQSWRESDAFKILEQFRGRLLVVIGENDDVIPAEIVRLLDDHSPSVAAKEIIILPSCSHNLHQCFAENPAAKEHVLQTMRKMIKN